MTEKAPDDKRVMVIDDDEIMRISCQQILKRSGYVVETFASGHEGIKQLAEIKPQILVVDIKMPEIDGFQVMEIVRKLDPDLVIVVITGYATIGTAVEAMKSGAYDFLPKPFTPDELRLIIRRGYERWQLVRESQLLRREKEEAERKFVTLVSHQLKSPLAAVKQTLDVMLYTQKDKLPEKAIAGIERCQVRTQEMLGIIQDWLALAKLESAVLCDPRAQAELGPLLEQVVGDHREQADQAKVTLALEVADALPLVRGDALSLAMLFANLVGNAIKYNREGGRATVRAVCEGDGVRVEVEDTGIGIPEEAQKRLFAEFYRVKTEATENIPGTGLGLAICKKIISELGGVITVESTEGKGSTFRILLPLAQSSSSPGAGEGRSAPPPTTGQVKA
jgi:two-component system, sensor histidine kinase and response regulator